MPLLPSESKFLLKSNRYLVFALCWIVGVNATFPAVFAAPAGKPKTTLQHSTPVQKTVPVAGIPYTMRELYTTDKMIDGYQLSTIDRIIDIDNTGNILWTGGARPPGAPNHGIGDNAYYFFNNHIIASVGPLAKLNLNIGGYKIDDGIREPFLDGSGKPIFMFIGSTPNPGACLTWQNNTCVPNVLDETLPLQPNSSYNTYGVSGLIQNGQVVFVTYGSERDIRGNGCSEPTIQGVQKSYAQGGGVIVSLSQICDSGNSTKTFYSRDGVGGVAQSLQELGEPDLSNFFASMSSQRYSLARNGTVLWETYRHNTSSAVITHVSAFSNGPEHVEESQVRYLPSGTRYSLSNGGTYALLTQSNLAFYRYNTNQTFSKPIDIEPASNKIALPTQWNKSWDPLGLFRITDNGTIIGMAQTLPGFLPHRTSILIGRPGGSFVSTPASASPPLQVKTEKPKIYFYIQNNNAIYGIGTDSQ